jgi:membrane-associated PAP2 superfamily phosphatase
VNNRKDARFVAINLSVLAMTGFLLVWLSRDGSLDFAVSSVFFDPATGGFPLRDVPLFAVLGHAGLKWLVLCIWACGAVAAAFMRKWRSPLLFFCATVVLTTLAIALSKMASAHSCPWDIRGFGGAADWFPLFDWSGSPGPGHCWPGGHAAGGFSLLAGYFAVRRYHRTAARFALAAALGLGALMSWVQIARGAHFLSHNLWSLWIAWFCSLAGFCIWRMIDSRGRE